MKTMHMLLVVALLAAALGIQADKPEKPPKGQGKYLIVLWEPGTPVPGKKDERMKRVAEPDVDKLGGRLLSKQANRRVVFLPYAAAKQLRKHEAVSFVQRIWMGEPLSEWNETNANMRAIRTDDVSTNDDPTFTWDKSYGYDAVGNITTIGSDTFAYDELDRLTQASIDGASQSYSYDAFGNLTTIVTDGSSKSIPADPSSNRMIGPTYDAAGNLTSRNGQGTYVYDSLNMLVEYGASPNISTRRILYDADDERIVALNGLTGPHRWTIRGLDGQVLREFTSWEMGPYFEMVWEQDHIRGEGQLIAGETVEFHYLPDPTLTSDFMWGGKRHYHLDHLGSVRVVTNDDGKAISENDLFPFGTARTKQYQEQINWGNPHTDGMRFAGHWRDFMGHPEVEDDDYLDYMHARYYDPNLGRFLSVDPTWESADLGKPQTWNRYSYALNNPINLTDPDGKCSICLDVLLDGDTPLFEKGYDPKVSDNPPRTQAEFDQRVREGRAVQVKADRPYQRPSGATTPQQRASVQGKPCEVCGEDDGAKRVAGHKKALVQEHYETGTIDKQKMRSLDAVRPECPTCSAKEGAAMSRYSRAMKEALKDFVKKLFL